MALRFFDQTRHLFGELAKSLFAVKRFVESKEIENDGRLAVRQMFVGITKVLRTNSLEGLVAGETQVANNKLKIGEALMQQTLPIILGLQTFA